MHFDHEIIHIIKKAMKEQKFSVAELVRQTGYTRRAIDYWLHGERNISLKAADKILSVLGVQYTLGDDKNEWEKDNCRSDRGSV